MIREFRPWRIFLLAAPVSRLPSPWLAKCEPTFAPEVFGGVKVQRFSARVCSKRTGHQERKKHRDCGGGGYTGISPMANIFARGSREPAPVAMARKMRTHIRARCFRGRESSASFCASVFEAYGSPRTKKAPRLRCFVLGDPYGNRTHVSSVRG